MPKKAEPIPPPSVSLEVAVGQMHAALALLHGHAAGGASLMSLLLRDALVTQGESTDTILRASDAASTAQQALENIENCGANPPAEALTALILVAEEASKSEDEDLARCAWAALLVAGRRVN